MRKEGGMRETGGRRTAGKTVTGAQLTVNSKKSCVPWTVSRKPHLPEASNARYTAQCMYSRIHYY